MLRERYRMKLEEELALLSSQVVSIGTPEQPAYYLQIEGESTQCIIQVREENDAVHFTYSVLVKKLGKEELQELPILLAKNWEYSKIFLWPMEINEEWYLLASIRSTYETYLPGQIRNQLNLILEEWLALEN